MKVILISINDNSNVGYNFEQSLKSVDVDAISFCKYIHKLQYLNHSKCYSYPRELLHYVNKSDIIIFMHSKYIRLETDLSSKKIFVFHGGTTYRQNPEIINKIFNPIVEKSLIQTGDLLDLGAKNQQWILPSVDTDLLLPCYERVDEKLIISHYPTGYAKDTKGSSIILKVITKMQNDPDIKDKFIFNFSEKKVPWKQNIERVKLCDIYLEAFNLTFQGKKYGEFGVAGLEAASLGKILVTHFLSSERYKKVFGNHPIQVINCEDQIEKVLRFLLSLNKQDLHNLKVQTRNWVENVHGLKPTGKRLKKILNI